MDFGPRTEYRLRILADGRNRAILDIVAREGAALPVTELADRLVSDDLALVDDSTYDEAFDRACFELHHRRLPKLDDAGLVDYDRDANVVDSTEPPSAETEWVAETDFEELVAYLEEIHDVAPDGIGIVEGRDAVFRYGRELTGGVKEELFTLYASPQLLEDDCLGYGEGVIDRGASLFIGSNDETVRELTRKHLPAATVWEPQFDWLNRPSFPRVGRLLFADRRAVMLSILDEPPAEADAPQETALVGEGHDNPLVVLVRELLGPRLDHLDYQSADFQGELST